MRRRPVEEPDARPHLNMTPMIDVTFQLIVVFLCSMKFRTLDMKIEATLPDQGEARTVQPVEVVPRTRLRLAAPATGPAFVTLAGERIGDIREGPALWSRVQSALRRYRAADPAVVGEIDAAPAVHHGDVVSAMDAFVGAGIEDVRFRGTPPPR